ncbi:MAG: hypothetical protein QW303_04995 [Nitrososphaerota archaeon]
MKYKKSFLWTAAIAYIITLLILPLNLRNNNEKILLETIHENIDAIYLNKVENNIVFELYSFLIDNSKLRIINSNKLNIQDLISFLLSRLDYFKEIVKNYYKSKGVELSIYFSDLSISEYSSNFLYNPILLNSKKLNEINDIEGTLNIFLKASFSLHKGNIFLNRNLNLTILCPCRIFLLNRIVLETIKSINQQIILLTKYNITDPNEIIEKYGIIIYNAKEKLRNAYESRQIKIDLFTEYEIKYINDFYEIRLTLNINVYDKCEAASILLNGRRFYPLIAGEHTWLVLLNESNIEIC